MNNFRRGSIKKVRLQNFQVFTDEVFTFGPTLNLVVAPNGSGKSAIANALGVLFGASLRVLGNGRSLGDYVKFGQKTASVYAEVKGKEIESVSFEQKITISNQGTAKNELLVNGKACSAKVYGEKVRELEINVDSLCNFLPQERVAEFCRMDPETMLGGVLEARGGQDGVEKVYKKEEEVKRLSKEIEKLEKQQEIVSETLGHMQRDVEKEEERKELEKRLLTLEYQVEVEKYEAAKAKYLEYQEKQKRERQRMEEVQEKLEESIEKEEVYEQSDILVKYKSGIESVKKQNERLGKLRDELRELRSRSKAAGEGLKKAEEKKWFLESEVKNLESKCESEDEKTRRLYAELRSAFECLKTRLEEVTYKAYKELEVPETATSIVWQEKISMLNQRIEEQEAKYNVSETIRHAQIESKRIETQIKEIEDAKEKLEKEEEQRLEQLKKYHTDTYKGVVWLRDNKKRFHKEVLEPAYLHIRIHEEYQPEVETLLGFQAISSFLVQDPRDFSLLARCLKQEMGLSVNIAEIGSNNSVEQSISQSLLSKYGFDGVASDFIISRPEYLTFLNTYGHFHSIPISRRNANINEAEFFREVPTCKRAVVCGRFIEIKRSKYDSEFLICNNPISYRGLFNSPASEISSLSAQLAALSSKREENRKKLAALYAEREKLEKKRSEFRESFSVNELSKALYKIEQFSHSRNDLHSAIQNLDKIKQKIVYFKTELQLISQSIQDTFHSLIATLSISSIPTYRLSELHTARLDLENTRRETQYLRQQIDKLGQSLSCSEEKQRLRSELDHLKEQVRKLHAINGDSIDFSLTIQTSADIHSEINFLKAKIGKYLVDKNLYTDYITKTDQLASINASLDRLRTEHESALRSYEKIQEQITSDIASILTPVNASFATFFLRFRASGRIELLKDPVSSKWGLEIYVSFRKGQQQERLTATRQSGGEKSLATALFLLALQNTVNVPFRLVDEINQGMDPTNERIFFEIIREMSLSSQFFIITPKLINDIVFPENACVSVIYSGKSVPDKLSAALTL